MMDKKYIKIAGIYKKIRKAESEQKTIYISGPVGYGKTTSVENYFSKKDHIILNGSEGFINMTPELSTLDGKVVIIDDISWIVSQDSIQYILDLVNQYSGQIVLIGRSKIPTWLRVSSVQKRFILADEKDLEFSEKEAKEL